MADARKGKIAQLPHAIRTELNQRLRDGQLGPVILPWLNALPETQRLLAARFNGEPVSAQNLSDWRQGGYADWEAKQEEAETIQELTVFARALAEKSGGSAADAAADIAGGRLLAAIETHLNPAAIRELLAEKPETLIDLISKITDLQSEARKKLSVEVDVQKFQRDTAELFIKWSADQRAKEIAASADAQPVKMEKLVQLMFGERPALKPVNV